MIKEKKILALKLCSFFIFSLVASLVMYCLYYNNREEWKEVSGVTVSCFSIFAIIMFYFERRSYKLKKETSSDEIKITDQEMVISTLSTATEMQGISVI
ncbi:hypothetical protein [Wolbachia endosymbiont of Pentidionis agamae]|uniref:hypothetical protein n=1 Tax=Wolbachia endosymbiont of Pentidionis agamae TaxID=3110435 RepID=UPI002FD2B2E1